MGTILSEDFVVVAIDIAVDRDQRVAWDSVELVEGVVAWLSFGQGVHGTALESLSDVLQH